MIIHEIHKVCDLRREWRENRCSGSATSMARVLGGWPRPQRSPRSEAKRRHQREWFFCSLHIGSACPYSGSEGKCGLPREDRIPQQGWFPPLRRPDGRELRVGQAEPIDLRQRPINALPCQAEWACLYYRRKCLSFSVYSADLLWWLLVDIILTNLNFAKVMESASERRGSCDKKSTVLFSVNFTPDFVHLLDKLLIYQAIQTCWTKTPILKRQCGPSF